MERVYNEVRRLEIDKEIMGDALQMAVALGMRKVAVSVLMQGLISESVAYGVYYGNQIRQKKNFNNAMVIDFSTGELILFNVDYDKITENNRIEKIEEKFVLIDKGE